MTRIAKAEIVEGNRSDKKSIIFYNLGFFVDEEARTVFGLLTTS